MKYNELETGSIAIQDVFMNQKQSEQEVMYKMSLKLLGILKRKDLIDDVQYAQIDELNRLSFSPQLAKVYV